MKFWELSKFWIFVGKLYNHNISSEDERKKIAHFVLVTGEHQLKHTKVIFLLFLLLLLLLSLRICLRLFVLLIAYEE